MDIANVNRVFFSIPPMRIECSSRYRKRAFLFYLDGDCDGLLGGYA
jgi:hypothetical protein